MSVEYAAEKFSDAADYLANVDGDVRKNLFMAARAFWPVSPSDIPPELQDGYDELMSLLTQHPSPRTDKGTIPNTLEKISEKEGLRISDIIFRINFGLRKHVSEK